MRLLCLRPYVLIVPTLFIALGCAGRGAPSAPDAAPPSDQPGVTAPSEPAHQGRSLLMAGEVTCDFLAQEITLSPLRTPLMHFDILPFLRNPSRFCPTGDCLKLEFLELHPDTGYFKIEATLENWSTFTGYDIRGIVYDNDQNNHKILNADDYTSLWAPPGYASVYPFRAFAKTDPDRAFRPMRAFSEVYEFQFDPLPAKWVFPYAVDCSWPGNCEEPFEIVDHMQVGELYPVHGCAKLSVRVNHHSGPSHVSTVTIYATVIGGEISEMAYNPSAGVHESVVRSQAPVVPGDYSLLVSASSPGTDIELYDYFDVTVHPASDPAKVCGWALDNDSGEGIPVARMTTSDGESLYTYDSDFCGYFAENGIPDGSRVLSLTKPGYHTSHVLTVVGGDDVVLEQYLHPNPADPPDMPEVEVSDPYVDEEVGMAIIDGHMRNLDCYLDNIGVYVHQGQEYLMDVDDFDDSFGQQIFLTYGVNEIVLRATNATGTVLSDKIVIEFYPDWKFRITLTWDTDMSDMDTHVWAPDLIEHCSYMEEITAHLQLDFDDVDGFGPENVTPIADAVPLGVYPIAVNYYDDHDDDEWEDQPTTCFVTLRLNPGTPDQETVILDHLLTVKDYNEGYPVQYDTGSWWRVCDLVLQRSGRVTWQEPNYNLVLYD